jgi:hypothetical protein
MATGNRWGIYSEDRSKRPRLAIPNSKVENLQDILSVTGILLMIAALIFQPPGTAPVVLVLLASAIFLFLLITFIRRYPHHFNYLVAITPENAEYQYQQARGFLGWLKTEVVWMFLGMQAAIELLAINMETAGLAAFLLVAILGSVVIHGSLLYYIFKMSSEKART